ncbi:mediator of DNA damage checkpoint protein 1 isoform X2 [Drosophila sulfurigaster albostrigata]|uniref:mediator of DNA damage checkpoint protein 1 isoform X2 n=1 Tax=Drosophila sulfurigaster albostrigata TaxID=89887 RepID=UPI002D219893|nr:mediator of DNA damage checkpoint protein 1 isoform X2 [Drosophila sulfurigaster albostrigata]
MVFVTFRFEDGTNPEAVQLQPDTIYRIGRKRELEFHSDDESLELAHATIALIAGGIVRIAAVAGKVFVNGSETEIQSISNSDIVNCLVDLKFGNVKAKLSFKEDKHDEAAHDSSGFEEETKDKSVDTTGDSFIIPETMPPPKEVCFADDKELEIQDRTVNKTSDSLVIPESMPPSANTTYDCDSFNIPETQAVPLHRQSKGPEVSKVSFDDDDFLIPETQEVLPQQNLRPDLEHKTNVVVDDDSSELGSQIRICTQEFNEFDEDAIDDFDSSLLLGDVAITVLGKGGLKQPADNAAVDQEVSALNWSATNTKYSAVNSTKLDEEHARNEACLTPELSAAGIPLDDVPCTPDLFDFINNEANQSSNSPPHELINVTADVHRNSVCRAEKSAVNSIETPDNTPGEGKDDNEDFIETQAFPMRKLIANDDDVATQAFNRNASWNDNDDFIATQVFPKRTSLMKTNLEDNIATQAFIRDPEVSKTKPKETDGNNSNTSSAFLVPLPKSTVNNSENFNNSNTSSPFKAPLAKPAVNDIANNSEDLIATQVFFKQPRVSETITKESTNSSINNNDDMQETQLFIPPKTADPNSSRLNISDCLSIGDELDHELKEFIALKSLPSSSEDEDFQFANSKCNTEKKEQNEISKEVANQSATTFSRKRLAVNVRNMSKSSTPITVESNDEKTPLATTKQNRKRSSTSNTKLTSPPKKQRSEENETLEYADEKTPLSSKMSRQANSKSEAIVDQTASARSESDTKTRSRKVKSNEKLDQAPSVRSESETKKGRSRRLKTTDEILHEKLDQAASGRSASETKRGRPKKLKTNDVILHETKDQAASVRSESDTKRGRPSKLKTNDVSLHETKNQEVSVLSASEAKGQRSKKPRSTDECVPEKVDQAASSRSTSKSRSEKSEIIQPIDQVAPPKRSKRLASLKTDSQSSEAAGTSKESTKETDVPPEKKVKKSKIESSSMPASETEVSSRSKSKKKTGKSESEPIFSDKAIASSSTPIAKSRDVAEKLTTASKAASKLDVASKPDGNTEVPSRSKSSKTTGKLDKVAKAEKGIPIAKAKDVAKTNHKDEEESATNNSRRKNNQQDPLQDINKYIMKIKRSGRKIQLSLSMCNYAELRQILHSLRNEFEVTDDPRCCDVLLMDRGERTYKFLIGIASNRPILSSCWLHDIKENRSLAVKSNHIFKDYKFMELFKFNPLAVLEPTNLLKGFNFMLGTDIQPNAKDMQAIIECAGGTVHRKAPPIASNVRLYAVASQKDKHMWQLLRNYTNLEYIKTEGVMQALVQHKPELLDEHKLIRL